MKQLFMLVIASASLIMALTSCSSNHSSGVSARAHSYWISTLDYSPRETAGVQFLDDLNPLVQKGDTIQLDENTHTYYIIDSVVREKR